MGDDRLPIDDALPALLAALREGTNAVLTAPPGAGKTTRVPLALLNEPWVEGRGILMLEPRRVAARAAAERMAQTLGETAGQRVGYRIRRESAVSRETRIEVITEGILTRILQSDPDLDGVAAVIFDEFHERSIHADLGLALALETQEVLRDDLRLLAMSATLDDGRVSDLMGDAPVIRSEGRAYPVETRWLETPWRTAQARRGAFETAVAETVVRAFDEEPGDALVFLPGVGEIVRVQRLLDAQIEARGGIVQPLHGSMPFARQRAALQPDAQGRRRVVLATAIAETSLTIADVRIVVDGGHSRQPRFDAGAGMTRLVTTRVSKASATQRQGRAGRTQPGVCYRVWTKGEEGGLAVRDRPEILDADLAPLMLDLALRGVRDPATLRWMDTPPDGAVEQARMILQALGALDDDGSITEHGKAVARQPLHPRLAHMRLVAGKAAGLATDLAALLEERDPLSGAGCDIGLRIEALRDAQSYRRERAGMVDVAALSRIRDAAKALKPPKGPPAPLSGIGPLIAAAYPDRIAMRRPGDAPRYLLSGGKGAIFHDEGDALAGESFLAVAHLDGNPREARIRLAARLSLRQIEEAFADRIVDAKTCLWDTQSNSVTARRERHLDALVLDSLPWKDAPKDRIAEAALDGFHRLGLDILPWKDGAGALRERVRWAAETGVDGLPDWSDDTLTETAAEWLLPHLGRVRTKADFAALPLERILSESLDWQAKAALDRLAPVSLATPAGTKAKIDYASDPPALDVRIQEMFGTSVHPSIGNGRIPLLVRLLSPARRPVQVTGDLPGFWDNSYADVRKDLRGRYPRHPWPENPLEAAPTARAKPRKSKK